MKYTKTFLLIIFTLEFLFGFIPFLAPIAVNAAYEPAQFKPQITIGEFVKDKPETVESSGLTIWNYIKAIYKYAIGVVGIVAAVVLMIGGIMWLTAGGNQTRIGEAKAYIGASLSGLLLALTSFMILATVNPKLVQFNPLDVTTVGDNSTTSGCCSDPTGCVSSMTDKTSCETAGFLWTSNGVCGTDNQCHEKKETCCEYTGPVLLCGIDGYCCYMQNYAGCGGKTSQTLSKESSSMSCDDGEDYCISHASGSW